MDNVYQRAPRFIAGCLPLKVTHRHPLYSFGSWSSCMCTTLHWYNFIYKSILGLLPIYLSTYMSRKVVLP